jgi:hypothetical protein
VIVDAGDATNETRFPASRRFGENREVLEGTTPTQAFVEVVSHPPSFARDPKSRWPSGAMRTLRWPEPSKGGVVSRHRLRDIPHRSRPPEKIKSSLRKHRQTVRA